MSRKKLTLSVEERLTRRAKAIAEERGTSVSRLVELFFTSLDREADVHEGENGGASSDEPERSADPEPSEWARRWRGAFAPDGQSYPDDPAWEEDLLTQEIEDKHTS
jgi:hypothetical protein